MENKIAWQVTENNAGGLTLHVWRDGNYIYACAGHEMDPSNLRNDLESLKNGEDPINDGWEGNDLQDESLARDIRSRHNPENGREEAPDDTDMFDDNGDLIPLTEAEYYDDHAETAVIADEDGPAGYNDMGNAGHSVFYPGGDPEAA